jgi:hypothetical protein
MTYTLTRATPADESTVTGMLAERVEWLASRGLDQWGAKDPARSTAATIAAGETWLLVDDSAATAVGTLTMTTRPDRDFWHDQAPALYLSKLATPLDQAGRGLGRLLVHAAYLYGQQHQVAGLRWDVWRTNTQLQDYYRDLGGEMVGIVEVAGRNSGALFEAMSRFHGRVFEAGSKQMVKIDAPIGVVERAAFTTSYETVGLPGGSRDFDEPAPRHFHHLLHLVDAAGQPYTVNSGAISPLSLHHDGDRWWLNTEQVSGDLLRPLRPGLPYLLEHREWFGEHFVEVRGDLVDVPDGDRGERGLADVIGDPTSC